MPPRGLRPSGLILVDKEPGPSSFSVVRDIRTRTGARTGHAGTLDPFATGLLLVLSGAATRLAPWLVGLEKRYLTEIDLRSRTSTGDPEGDVVGEAEPPADDALLARLDRLRGEVELPIPAASAVKVGGERAYRLARRGVALEMPLRRSRIEQLDVIAYTGEVVTLDLRVSSGTYVRSVADALGGHCRSLRRTEVGTLSGRGCRSGADPAAGRGAPVPAGPQGGRGNGRRDPAGPRAGDGGCPRAARRRARRRRRDGAPVERNRPVGLRRHARRAAWALAWLPPRGPAGAGARLRGGRGRLHPSAA